MEVQEITNLWKAVSTNRALLWLSIVIGMGGLLFGFDTGIYPGLLVFLRQHFSLVNKHKYLLDAVQVMSSVVAVFGAGLGGILSDWLGRKWTIIITDILYFLGAIMTVWPTDFWTTLVGRILVGFGIGMSSVSCTLYVAEIAPPTIRGSLISLYGISMSAGYLCSYYVTMGFIKVPGRIWMLGLASVPAALQFVFMPQLLESPIWLIRQGNFGQALQNLRRLYHESQAIRIFNKMRTSIDTRSSFQHFWTPFTQETFKSALFTSISIQLSHIIGAKVVSNQGYLETSTSESPLISAFVQLLGSIVTTLFVVDKFRRKTILIVSLVLAAILFLALSMVSYNSAQFVPLVQDESSTFDSERVCAAYRFQTISWSCITCLQHDCGFCASPNNQFQPGACLVNANATRTMCGEKGRKWHVKSCPNKYGYLIGILTQLYSLVHSIGLAVIPAIVNAEIFQARYLGIGGGLGSMAGWILSITGTIFFSMAKNQDPWDVYNIQFLCACLALFFVCMFVPETRGVPLEY